MSASLPHRDPSKAPHSPRRIPTVVPRRWSGYKTSVHAARSGTSPPGSPDPTQQLHLGFADLQERIATMHEAHGNTQLAQAARTRAANARRRAGIAAPTGTTS